MKTSCLHLEAAQMFLPNTFQHFFRLRDKQREGGGEESLTASLGQLPRANPSAGAGRGGRQGEVETPRQRGVMRTVDPDRSPGP